MWLVVLNYFRFPLDRRRFRPWPVYVSISFVINGSILLSWIKASCLSIRLIDRRTDVSLLLVLYNRCPEIQEKKFRERLFLAAPRCNLVEGVWSRERFLLEICSWKFDSVSRNKMAIFCGEDRLMPTRQYLRRYRCQWDVNFVILLRKISLKRGYS